MSQFQVGRRKSLSLRHVISGTSLPRAMSQIVLILWCITGGLLTVRIGTQWVWCGLSATLCGMPHVPVHNAEKQLVGSWAEHILQVSSIDMSFAPPLIVARVYNLSNWHWVLHLLLIAPTREYLCLKFDPVCDRPHIVGAHHEELGVVDLIAEREGTEPQHRKKWSKIVDAFGALAFAIAPLHSTFIQ